MVRPLTNGERVAQREASLRRVLSMFAPVVSAATFAQIHKNLTGGDFEHPDDAQSHDQTLNHHAAGTQLLN